MEKSKLLIKVEKFLYAGICSKDVIRPVLSNILYKNGNVVASDAYILIEYKTEYPAELENLIVNKKKEQGSSEYFPKYSHLLNADNPLKELTQKEISELNQIVKSNPLIQENGTSKREQFDVILGEFIIPYQHSKDNWIIAYSSDLLNKAYCFFSLIEEFPKILIAESGSLLFLSKNCKALIYKHCIERANADCYHFDILH